MVLVDGGRFTIKVTSSGDSTTIAPLGEIDPATAPALRRTLQSIDCERVVLDMSGVEFIDSSGLHVLMEAAERLPVLVVCSPSPAVARLFQITAADQMFRVEHRTTP